jgi:archaellum component FlaC
MMSGAGRSPGRREVPGTSDEDNELSEGLLAVKLVTDDIDRRLKDMGFDLYQVRWHQGRHDRRFDGVDKRLGQIDQRLEAVDQRLDAVDQRFEAVDERFDAVDRQFDEVKRDVDERFDGVDRRFDTMDAKLDLLVELVKTPGRQSLP